MALDPRPRFPLPPFWLAALLGVGFSGVGSRAQDVTVTITNADAVVAALPDTTLEADFFDEIDDDLDSIFLRNKDRGPEPQAYVALLLSLDTPEKITRTAYQGRSIKLSPVADFQAFVEAIDYGTVLGESSAKRTIKLEIDPAELQPEALRKRARAIDDEAVAAVEEFFAEEEEQERSVGQQRLDRIRSQITGRKKADLTERLGADLEPGDHVELTLKGKPFHGVVRKTKSGSFDSVIVQVALSDHHRLAKLTRKRSLKSRLERSEEFVFWSPAQRLRKLEGAPLPEPEERSWTDATGRYEVVATYAGMDGDLVRLKRANGKEAKVPLAKLSEADRSYVKQLEEGGVNPFAASRGSGGSLRADWSDLRTIKPRVSRRWKWRPPAIAAQASAETSVSTLDVAPSSGGGAFADDLENLFVARDGRSAVVLLTSGMGPNKQSSLQRLDFGTGKAAPIVECPPKSLVLDVLPEQRVVLLRNNESDNLRLYLRRLEENELTPICDFNALPPNAFHKKISDARLLAGNRILVRGLGGDWIIWDGLKGKALYHLDVGSGSPEIAIGPHGRFLFTEARDAIVVIDSQSGEHVASIPHNLRSIKRLSVDRELKRLAIATGDTIVTIDLTNGELIDGFSGGIVRQGEVDFIGDHLLVDNRYLVAPKYPLILWQYVMATRGTYDTHATVRGGRMWYAARQGGRIDGVWSIATIPAPHDAIDRTLAELGDLDDLVVLTPGDQVTVTAETDLDQATETRLRDALVRAFTTAGYQVVDASEADQNTKQAVVVCKRAKEPIEVMIANPDAEKPADDPTAFKPPRGFAIPPMAPPGFGLPTGADWMYEPHTVTPYHASVAIRQGDTVLWTDVSEVRAGQQLSPVADGTVQDVIKRLTSPDIERLANIALPGQICKIGPAGGAYGASLLDGDGIAEDYFGEEE